MKKTKTQIPTEFKNVLGSIYGNSEQQEEVTKINDETFLIDDVEKDFDVESEEKEDTPTEEDVEDVEENKNTSIEDTEEQQEDDQENNVEDISAEDVTEAEQIGALFDAVGESLGWNMNDISEEDRPVTVEDLTNYLSEVVNQNSVPHYSDDRVQQLDEYIKNGGNFEDFYRLQQETISFDNIDLEDENNQKTIVRQYLKYNGYTDEQINNKISRYEDADVLMEESEDALDRLKQIKQREIDESKKQQEEYIKQQEEASKMFLNDVTTNINNLTNIRGISIPKEDRKALFDYIFKVDQNGVSQYQKDFNENLTKNLIESAYFTMKADAFVQRAEKRGETSAAEKLRKMLRHSSKNHSSYNTNNKQKSVVEIASKFF